MWSTDSSIMLSGPRRSRPTGEGVDSKAGNPSSAITQARNRRARMPAIHIVSRISRPARAR